MNFLTCHTALVTYLLILASLTPDIIFIKKIDILYYIILLAIN